MTVADLDQALGIIDAFEFPEPVTPPELEDPRPFRACTPPARQDRTGPQFVVPFRRPILHPKLRLSISSEAAADIKSDALAFSCVRPTRGALYLAPDLRFEQTWNMTDLSVGDLSSTMALAPSEQLTIEFQNTQRRVLEQTRVDSAEEMASTESTTIDKEVVNTVQSASKTQEWHVDGSASYGVPGKSVNVNAGFRQSTQQTSQTTIDRTSETTNKSARNLKTLHKIEVRGVSEGLIQSRMTRRIKNPYPDRTLILNVFHLLKHFDVETRLTEIRPALIIQVDDLAFDNAFVLSNADFLGDTLTDPALVDDLPLALQGADPLQQAGNLGRAREAAKLALHYLFDEVVIFGIQEGPGSAADPLPINGGGSVANAGNSIEVGFDAGLRFDLGGNLDDDEHGNFPEEAGILDANRTNLGAIFTTLSFFYKVYRDTDPVQLDERAIALVTAIAEGVSADWTAMKANTDAISNILDNRDFTEIFRRLSGFLAMADNMVKPVGGTTAEELQILSAQEQSSAALTRLLEHLRCNENFYTQQFLLYRASRTNNQAVVDFVNGVIDEASAVVPALSEGRDRAFDVEHSFIDKQQIVVPGLRALTEDEITELTFAVDADRTQFSFDSIKPSVLKDVQVPTDGIHLEVAQGECRLEDIPAPEDGQAVPPGFRAYVVQPGDTLDDIAQRFDTTVDELMRLNGIEDPNLISAGQVLFMPLGPST